MAGLDVFLGVVIAFGVWRGLRTGALLQIVGTLGWVVGFVAASALMGPVGDAVAASLGVSERTAPVLGFVVVVVGVVVALVVTVTVAAADAAAVISVIAVIVVAVVAVVVVLMVVVVGAAAVPRLRFIVFVVVVFVVVVTSYSS